jgi:hypothetical protein
VTDVLPEEILQPSWHRYLGDPQGGRTLYLFEKDDWDIFLFATLDETGKSAQLIIQRKPPVPELPKPTLRQRLGTWIHG